MLSSGGSVKWMSSISCHASSKAKPAGCIGSSAKNLDHSKSPDGLTASMADGEKMVLYLTLFAGHRDDRDAALEGSARILHRRCEDRDWQNQSPGDVDHVIHLLDHARRSQIVQPVGNSKVCGADNERRKAGYCGNDRSRRC